MRVVMHRHLRPIGIIARFCVLEAVRMRLALLLLVALGVTWLLAYFAQALAITDADRLQVAFFAAGARVVCIFVLAMFVLASMLREVHDKGLELILSFDLQRSHYILGKLLGFLSLGWCAALLATLSAASLTPPMAALQWGLSLAFEISLVVALTLFCVVTFTHLIAAAGAVFAFYLLSRTIAAIQLMSAAPLSATDTLSHRMIATSVDIIALLVPALDNFANTSWLVDHPVAWWLLAGQAAQTAVYIGLLALAAMFDFYRRSL